MSEWIRAKDKLPLEFHDADKIIAVIVTDGIKVRPACFFKRSNRRGWDCLSEVSRVTHWMPLPSPPTED